MEDEETRKRPLKPPVGAFVPYETIWGGIPLMVLVSFIVGAFILVAALILSAIPEIVTRGGK